MTPTRRRWLRFAAIAAVAVALLLVLVLVARWLRTLPEVAAFLASHPGTTELPEGTPTGLPAWLGWQHFLNVFFLLLIIRTGWLVRTVRKPAAYWTPRRSGLLRPQGPPARISIDLWLHLCLDVLWLLNGVVFVVLVFASGHWVRIVPTSWEIVPNAVSTAIQYASLDWPTESGWANYNSLQVLAYFATVFVAAPLAVISGVRMSPWWPRSTERLNRLYPISVARRIHFPVMWYFMLFVVAHVTLVLATGALRNLNHMYAARNDDSWVGFGIFVISLVVLAAGWIFARPLFLRPIASIGGKVSR